MRILTPGERDSAFNRKNALAWITFLQIQGINLQGTKMGIPSQITLAALARILTEASGKGRMLMASVEQSRPVYLSGRAMESSAENLVFREVPASEVCANVDTFSQAFQAVLADTSAAAGLKIWVEVEGVAYPVDPQYIGSNEELVLMVLHRGTGVKP